MSVKTYLDAKISILNKVVAVNIGYKNKVGAINIDYLATSNLY